MPDTVEISTDARVSVSDITAPVRDALGPDVSDGRCTVFVPHTTAGVFLNEAEPRLLADLETHLESLVPADADYRHDAIDDNADAHLRAALLGSSVTVPVVDGRLDLGRWQAVLFAECDGPRTRRVRVLPPRRP